MWKYSVIELVPQVFQQQKNDRPSDFCKLSTLQMIQLFSSCCTSLWNDVQVGHVEPRESLYTECICLHFLMPFVFCCSLQGLRWSPEMITRTCWFQAERVVWILLSTVAPRIQSLLPFLSEHLHVLPNLHLPSFVKIFSRRTRASSFSTTEKWPAVWFLLKNIPAFSPCVFT